MVYTDFACRHRQYRQSPPRWHRLSHTHILLEPSRDSHLLKSTDEKCAIAADPWILIAASPPQPCDASPPPLLPLLHLDKDGSQGSHARAELWVGLAGEACLEARRGVETGRKIRVPGRVQRQASSTPTFTAATPTEQVSAVGGRRASPAKHSR